jgi:hypothetical protein
MSVEIFIENRSVGRDERNLLDGLGPGRFDVFIKVFMLLTSNYLITSGILVSCGSFVELFLRVYRC